VSGAYPGVQGVLVAVEGEDGHLGFGFKVHDPAEGNPGLGVLADFAADSCRGGDVVRAAGYVDLCPD
jgi:hypothetical protein